MVATTSKQFISYFKEVRGNTVVMCRASSSLKKSSAFEKPKEKYTFKHRTNTTRSSKPEDNSSDSDYTGLIVRHVLSVSDSPQSHQDWIVDSGATSHICNNRN